MGRDDPDAASPLVRRSRQPAGSFDGGRSAPPPKALRRMPPRRRVSVPKEEALKSASESLVANRLARQQHRKKTSGPAHDEAACVVRDMSLAASSAGGGGGLDAMAAGCLLPQLAATPHCFRYLETLDLSGTRVSTGGIRALAHFLGCAEDCHLKALRLDKCGVSDGAAAALFRGVERAKCLKNLSVAKNRVGPKATVALAKALHGSRTDLRDLNASGNSLHGLPLAFLCESLAHSVTVRRFDLSWNLLGKVGDDEDPPLPGEAPPAVLALARCLARNRVLHSLSLANCGLDGAAVEALAAGLEENRSLVAVALRINEGNAARCDAKMFLEVSLASPDGRGKARDKGHCWSDAGYREIEFRFEARASGDTWDPTKPLYLHLDCDGWRADLMEADGQQDDDDFDRYRAGRHAAAKPLKRGRHQRLHREEHDRSGATLFRVVPPGRRWYFFSQDDEVLLADDHQSAAQWPRGISLVLQALATTPTPSFL